MLNSLKEITIIPAKISDIDSRSECNPYYGEILPLFTAPMSAVVGVNSWKDYMNNKINPIIPRNVSLEKRLNFLSNTTMFVSFSLSEIQQQFIDKDYTDYNGQFHILIDIANGNMRKMFDLVKQLKEKYEDVVIMAGNIANPETYEKYCQLGIDYCRVGIGGGSGCFIDGTLVTMYDFSKKPIEEVELGDQVYTKNGIFTVIGKSRLKCNNTILINNEIECTSDHEFYVINKSDLPNVNEENYQHFAYWVEAKHLNKDSHLLIKLDK